jgi:tetratricopeptide (TPR) repeat protein
MRFVLRVRLALVGLLWLAAASSAIADQVIDQARKLLEQGNPKAAYALLLPLQSQRAGEIEYDYFLGVAALDAGDPQQAVFALERVLAVNPNFLQARAEIARAYFMLGERQTARREFESVRAQSLPPEARETIDRYLSALAPQRTEVRAYIEMTGGWDSNVNSATGKSAIAIPAFGGTIATLNPLGVRESSWFGGLGTGVSLSHGLSDQWYLIGAASYAGKYNFDVDGFDTGQVDASAGVRWASGNHQVLTIGQFQRFWVDYEAYRDSAGGTVQWLYNFSPSQQFTVFGQYARLTYPDQSPRDANRYIGGVGYSQALALPYSPVFFISAYGGQEKVLDSRFPWLSFTPVGLRLGGQLSLSDRALLFASASYEHRSYDGVDTLFLVKRRDDQTDARLGLAYLVAPSWTLTPQVAYTNNYSNIQLNSYNRTVGSVSVRRDF